MSELDDFQSTVIPRQIEAETAFHNGDVEPRLAMWSRRDPVSILGAMGMVKTGWDEVEKVFRWVVSRFSNCTEYTFETVAVDVCGDMAYTVGWERSKVDMDGRPVSHLLRVTHVYRREEGEWRIAHRHGDSSTEDQMAVPK